GFTGTSIWIDPDRDMFVILLTNRVDDPRAKRPATVIADVRADLSDAAALAVTDDPEGMLSMPPEFRADLAVDWNKPLPHHVAAKKPATSTTHKASPASTSAAAKASNAAAAAQKSAPGKAPA